MRLTDSGAAYRIPLSKSIQILTVNASWNEVRTLSILWKSRGVYVLNFCKISVQNLVLWSLPLSLHMWGWNLAPPCQISPHPCKIGLLVTYSAAGNKTFRYISPVSTESLLWTDLHQIWHRCSGCRVDVITCDKFLAIGWGVSRSLVPQTSNSVYTAFIHQTKNGSIKNKFIYKYIYRESAYRRHNLTW